MPPPDGFDARTFFAGDWSFLRLIEDRRLKITGSIIGHARVEARRNLEKKRDAKDEVFAYTEKGNLVFGDHQGAAERRYLYRFPNASSVVISFEDERPFHAFAIIAGRAQAEHRCAEDLYRTEVTLLDRRSWRSRWRITGPRKDLILETAYLKLANDRPGCKTCTFKASYEE